MDEAVVDRLISCDKETFKKCIKDEKFAYIVTLARATNALSAIFSLWIKVGGPGTPEGNRDYISSYLFSCGLLYEALQLIKKMNKPFALDHVFQGGLRTLLKDPVARSIEQQHLKRSRHHTVFHFVPETFAEMINKTEPDDCVFASSRGKKRQNIHYSFADDMAMDIHIGPYSGYNHFEQILEQTSTDASDLVVRFAKEAEILINHHLAKWGFKQESVESHPQSTSSS